LTIEDVPVRLIRHSVTGELGAILVVLAEHAAWLWDWLRQRAQPQGLTPIGWEALNVLRIEAGIPWFGIDMDETNVLSETGLEEQAVSDTKGCYVGQEVIARLQTYGSVSRKLMGLACEGLRVPQPKDPITKGGDALGTVTSACCSPALNRPIALGYVKRPFYEAGTLVTILHEGQTIAAQVVKRPFINKSVVHRP
jgi:folate-binding protein YgfZ